MPTSKDLPGMSAEHFNDWIVDRKLPSGGIRFRYEILLTALLLFVSTSVAADTDLTWDSHVEEWERTGLTAALCDEDPRTIVALPLDDSHIWTVLSSMDRKTKQRIAECTSPRLSKPIPDVQRAAAAVFAHIEDTIVIQPHRQPLELLLKSTDTITAIFSARALTTASANDTAIARLWETANVNSLDLYLDTDELMYSWEILRTTWLALGHSGSPSVEKELLSLAAEPGDKTYLPYALAEFPSARAIASLSHILCNPQKYVPETVEHAADASVVAIQAGRLKTKDVLECYLNLIQLTTTPLKKNSESDLRDIKMAASQAIAELKAQGAIPSLRAVAEVETNSNILSSELDALVRLGDAEFTVPLVLSALKNPRYFDHRIAFLSTLARTGAKDAYDPLVDVALHGGPPQGEIGAAAIGLARLGYRQEALESLVWIAFYAQRRRPEFTILRSLGPLTIPETVMLLGETYKSVATAGKFRFYAAFGGATNPDASRLTACFGAFRTSQCATETMNEVDTQSFIQMMSRVWPLTEQYPELRIDIANATAEVAATRPLNDEARKSLTESTKAIGVAGPRYTAQYKAILQAIAVPSQFPVAVRWIAEFLAVQFILWAVLIIWYPRSPRIQAVFFWNRQVRRLLGLYYVDVVLLVIPPLGRRLLSPFRSLLVSDAALNHFDAAWHYDGVRATNADGMFSKLVDLLPLPFGQTILQGESGLGKTTYLRRLALNAVRPLVFLNASRCKDGVIEAIQSKVFGQTADRAFLEALVYTGALDVIVDGLNEVSPDARARITQFLDRYLRCNVVIGTQPLEWTPPKTTQVLIVQALDISQIRQFLMGTATDLPIGASLRGEAFQEACNHFLDKVLADARPAIERSETLRMLSNPLDLSVIAAMIAHELDPDLFRLRQQQYKTMAADFTRSNVGEQFPLDSFSEHCYQLRCSDQIEISSTLFQRELLCMERHKLVVRREDPRFDGQPVVNIRWLFRHDKIMDFFVAHTFLGSQNQRPSEHISDPRFRGVYLLLVTLLPLDAAISLREQLVVFAATTQDHTLSDSFVLLLRDRQRTSIDRDPQPSLKL